MKLPRFLVLPLLFLFAILGPARAAGEAGTLRIVWIDSEGGGSTLIVTPAGESVLIDTGNPGGRDPARIVAAAQAAGLARIDHVIVTHWHTDHFGGAAEVAAQLPFGTIYERALPAGDPDGRAQSTFPVQIKPYRDLAVRRVPIVPGLVLPLRAGPAGTPPPVLRCLAADQKFVPPTDAMRAAPVAALPEAPAKAPDRSDNANSAVFVLEFGGFRFFAGGDLTWNVEEKLVSPHNLAGAVDVYQTNHHGLEVSNHPLLVRALDPTVVVMNNGPKKGGQPGAFAAIRGARNVQALYQVHQSYNVPAETNAPREHIANHDNLTGPDAAKCPAHPVHLTVAADGKSYTVAVPSTGHRRTFRTKG